MKDRLACAPVPRGPAAAAVAADALSRVLEGPAFSDIDRHFAAFMERLAGGNNPTLRLAAALVSQRRGEGDICLDLAAVAGAELPTNATPVAASVRCPDSDDWLKDLRGTPVVGQPGEVKPLILDAAGRLYLHRYWKYEQDLAADIRSRLAQEAGDIDWPLFREGLARLFRPTPPGEVDWQKVAVFAAMRKPLCVISGGPGTGKTRTVVVLLALLLEQACGHPLRIAVAAPTGKAAARIQESIKHAKAALECTEQIKAALPAEAATIHRLLGSVPGSPYFKHDASNLLAVDALVVDEASMVDLALMAKLLAAIPPQARVLLVGDKDQLASVEAGAVLGDLCLPNQVNRFSPQFRDDFARVTGDTLPASADAGADAALVSDCFVQLQKNYRFGERSAIYLLSQAINAGDEVGAISTLRGCAAESGVASLPLPSPAGLKEALRQPVLAGFGGYLRCPDPAEALTRLSHFRILCAVRQGPYGVAHLNRLVEEILDEAGLILRGGVNYAGRPILIARNDYNLGLFNGDVGLMLRRGDGGDLRACFLGADQTLREFAPVRLPAHETVFAMTVHKSQGSEFERLLLVLPDRENPVLTRELVYTGLTRASRSAAMWLTESVFRAAVHTSVRRASGLRAAVWGDAPPVAARVVGGRSATAR